MALKSISADNEENSKAGTKTSRAFHNCGTAWEVSGVELFKGLRGFCMETSATVWRFTNYDMLMILRSLQFEIKTGGSRLQNTRTTKQIFVWRCQTWRKSWKQNVGSLKRTTEEHPNLLRTWRMCGKHNNQVSGATVVRNWRWRMTCTLNRFTEHQGWEWTTEGALLKVLPRVKHRLGKTLLCCIIRIQRHWCGLCTSSNQQAETLNDCFHLWIFIGT